MKNSSMIKPGAKDEISALKKRIRELEQSEPDLKRVEERLRESEARFRNEQKFSQLLLDTSPAFIVAIDFNGKTLMMNQALLDALEYTREEITGTDYLATFVPEEDRQGLARVFQQIINEGRATVNENRIRNKSGQTYLVEWHSRTVHKEGDVGFFVGVGIDITKRKQAELELNIIDRALASSEEKYRELVENANSIILRMDTTGRITFFNEYASRFLGFSRDEIIGHNVVGTIVPPTDSAGKDLAQMIIDIGAYPELYKNNENENMRKDGTRVWVAWTNKPILDDQGRCIEILCIGNDITERKQAEEALKESEGIFSQFMQHSPIYVFFKDENVRTIKLSKNYEALLGRPLRECIGKTMYDLFPSDLAKNMIEDDLKVLREGKPIEIKEELGGRFYSTTKFPVVRDGKPPFLAGFTIDITSHKRAEDAVCENQRFLATLIKNLDGMVYRCRCDRNWTMEFVSEGSLALTGYTPEQLLGSQTIAYGDLIYPEDRQMVWEMVQASVKTKQPFRIEYRIIDVNGAKKWVWEQGIGIYSESGDLLALEGFITDITYRKDADDALQETHRRLFDIIDFLPDATFVIDQERKVIAWNKAIELMTGIKKEDIIGKGDYAYAVPFYGKPRPILIDTIFEGAENNKNRYDLFTREGSTFSAEVYVPTTYQGKGAYLSATASPLFDTEGRTIGAIESIRDVTEGKRVERELQESEARYRIAIENSNDGIAIMKGDVHLYVNQRFVEMFGYNDPDEIIGKSNRKTVHPDDFKLVQDINARRQRGEHVPASYEFKGIKKDGAPLYLEVSATGTSYQGQPVSLSFLRDITERKQAEEAITGERKKLQTLSDNAPFGMVLIDQEDHFTYINRRFTELFGYDLSEIPDGRTWCRKAYPDAEYRHTVISAWRADLLDVRPGEEKNIFTVTCKDGTQKIVRFIFSVLVTGDYLMTCEDITELRQLENQLRQAQKMEAIGTLAGGIAHDFNNILTALMGYATLMQMKMDTTDPLRSYVDEVLLASEKAVDLTQSLLAFSRKQSVTLVPVNMNHTIKEAAKLLRRLLTEDIELRIYFANDDTNVMADKSQMDQILFNLVTNARDAMPKGGTLTIETAIAVMDDAFIRAHGFGESGNYVQLKFTDTGMGMDEITRQMIFDPFFTTKESGKGTGLGLATVYGIVKSHKGYITVDSALNKGCTFHIYLPHEGGTVDETAERIIPFERGNETILIAEDNEGVRRFMRDALQKYGYTVREAVDGEDAIEKFKEHRDIELIIIDSVMPKKNGREAYEEIHRIDPHVKAIFTSGYTKDIVLDKGIEEKEFDFIGKPLSLNKLLLKVREVLDR